MKQQVEIQAIEGGGIGPETLQATVAFPEKMARHSGNRPNFGNVPALAARFS